MSCAKPLELIHAHLDGELDVVRSLEIEEHLRECTTCAGAYEALRSLRSALPVQELSFKAPPSLHKRIRKALRVEAKSEGWSWAIGWRWLSAAVSAAAIAMLALAFFPLLGRSGGNDRLIDELVSGHVRSLMVEHLTDVASSDKHTVKPWFDGKINFAPPVSDFAATGFALVGGRLDYIAGRSVAALVYRHRAHLVNLFIWPDQAGTSGMKTSTSGGYSLVHWNDTDLSYWAVSDLNLHDLTVLTDLVRQSRSGGGE